MHFSAPIGECLERCRVSFLHRGPLLADAGCAGRASGRRPERAAHARGGGCPGTCLGPHPGGHTFQRPAGGGPAGAPLLPGHAHHGAPRGEHWASRNKPPAYVLRLSSPEHPYELPKIPSFVYWDTLIGSYMGSLMVSPGYNYGFPRISLWVSRDTVTGSLWLPQALKFH